MEKFFMLYREGGRSPTVKHSAESDAKREAERIAREHGGPVYLLEAVAKVEVKWEAVAVSTSAALSSTVDAVNTTGKWVDFDIGYRAMVREIIGHPTLTARPSFADGSVEVEPTSRGCRVRAWTEFGADWLAQRKAQAEPNGPPTPEQAKAHALAHDVGNLWGRWLHCANGLNGPPMPVCVDDRGIVVSTLTAGLVGRTAQAIGGKWFPLAIDGSPLSGKDPHDDDIPF